MAGTVQKSGILQELAEVGSWMRSELLGVEDRKLKSGAFQMTEQDFKIIGVDMGMFRGRSEEILGVLEFLERQVLEMGHGDLLVTAPYRDLRVSVCRFGFVQVGLSPLICRSWESKKKHANLRLCSARPRAPRRLSELPTC